MCTEGSALTHSNLIWFAEKRVKNKFSGWLRWKKTCRRTVTVTLSNKLVWIEHCATWHCFSFSFSLLIDMLCIKNGRYTHLIWSGWSPEGSQQHHRSTKPRQRPESDWSYWLSAWSPARLCLPLSFQSRPWRGSDPGNLRGGAEISEGERRSSSIIQHHRAVASRPRC